MGLVDCCRLVCLVLDEAHKAAGNYAYCKVIRNLLTVHNRFRILALSATPGSSIDKVQDVIHNLCISRMEVRDHSDPDVKPYVHERLIDTVVIGLSRALAAIKRRFYGIMSGPVNALCNARVVMERRVEKVNKVMLLRAQKNVDEIVRHVAPGMSPVMLWSAWYTDSSVMGQGASSQAIIL